MIYNIFVLQLATLPPTTTYRTKLMEMYKKVTSITLLYSCININAHQFPHSLSHIHSKYYNTTFKDVPHFPNQDNIILNGY